MIYLLSYLAKLNTRFNNPKTMVQISIRLQVVLKAQLKAKAKVILVQKRKEPILANHMARVAVLPAPMIPKV